MFKHRFETNWEGATGSNPLSGREVVEAEGEIGFDAQIEAATKGRILVAKIDPTKLQSLFVLSDRDLVVSVGDDVAFELRANVPRVWTPASFGACPLPANADTWLVDNHNDQPAKLSVRALVDPTP